MTGEALFAGGLAGVGGLLLWPARRHLTTPLALLLAYPVGQIAWVWSAFLLALSGAGFTPVRATVGVALAAPALALVAVRRLPRPLLRLAEVCAAAVAAALAAAAIVALNPTAMTNDSFIMAKIAQVLLNARGFDAPADLLQLRSFPLHPSLLQTVARPPGQAYLVAAAPLFNLSGLAALACLLRQHLRRSVAGPWDVVVPLLLLAALLSTDLLALMTFYVRGNLEFAVSVALYAVLTWRGMVWGRAPVWWPLGLVFLLGATLLRVESPFLLLPFVALQGVAGAVDRRLRVGLVAGYAAVLLAFYGTVQITRGEGIVLDPLSLGLLLAGTVAVALLAVAAALRPSWGRWLEARLPLLLVGGLALAALSLTLIAPRQMLASAAALVVTALSPLVGLWGLTWTGAVALLVIAARGRRLAAGAFLWAPLVWTGLFVYVLSFFTPGPYEVRWSTSPNRLLSALLVPALSALVLRACASREPSARAPLRATMTRLTLGRMPGAMRTDDSS